MSGSTRGPVEQRIRALAEQHGIAVGNTPPDNQADEVSQRSGHVDGRDPVEDMIATLRQKGSSAGVRRPQLYWSYVQEKAP